jgi:hypothetical protein
VQGGAEDDDSRIGLAYRLLFSREPDDTERALALAFLNKSLHIGPDPLGAIRAAAPASNELLYVD